MIVEPTPTNPRSPVRRALRLAGIVLPVVLFAAVLGVGLLGPKPEPAAPVPSAVPPEAAPATPAVSPGGDSASTRPADLAGAPPATVASIRVRSVSATLETWRAGDGAAIVAVAGYLRGGGNAMTCGVETVLPGSACARPVVIAETPVSSSSGAGSSGRGAQIHAVVPPGVLLPGDPGGPTANAGGSYPFVVVIGRFGASDAGCTGDLRGCEDPFTVERIAWADGESVAIVPGAQASLAASASDPVVVDTPRATRAALGPTTALLRVLLLGAGLEAVDPTAAGAIAEWSASPAAGAVWYLRVLDVPASPLPGPFRGLRTPQIRWAVVSRRTGALIASGVVPGPATASTSPG